LQFAAKSENKKIARTACMAVALKSIGDNGEKHAASFRRRLLASLMLRVAKVIERQLDRLPSI
jgi:hypothetical protein